MVKNISTKNGISFDAAINEEIVNKKKIFVAHCLNFEVTSQGRTIEEAVDNIKDAVSLYLKECPEEIPNLRRKEIIPPLATRIFL